MKRLLIPGAVVAASLVVLVLAGCGGGGDGGGSGMSSSGASASSNGGATVSTEQVGDAGNVLVDSTGHALYANDQEKGGMVLCDGACLKFWTPLTLSSGAPKGDSLPGKLGVVSRPDGDKQVTYNGKLLYTFYLDGPGKVGGDGFDDAFGGQQFTWHVVHGDKTASSPSPATQQPDNRGYPGY